MEGKDLLDSVWKTRSPNPLPRNADGTLKTDLTSVEVVEYGILSDTPIPPPERCEYCGKVLYHHAIIFGGMVICWRKQAERCTCDKAKAVWAQKDRERAKKAEEERLENERKKKVERFSRLLASSGIKKRFESRTFENFRTDTEMQKRAYTIAKRYADNFDKASKEGYGLYIVGGNGTGKTHIAAAITLQLIGQGIPVIFKTSPDLFGEIKKVFGENESTRYEVTQAYKSVDLLIIDDLGKERCSEWSMTTLYDIINDRYEDYKPTIVVTNYTPDDLADALTPSGGDRTKIDAIISRLRETTTLIRMYGDDNRMRK